MCVKCSNLKRIAQCIFTYGHTQVTTIWIKIWDISGTPEGSFRPLSSQSPTNLSLNPPLHNLSP